MTVLQFPCHLGIHISSLRADLMCAVFSRVQAMAWLLMPRVLTCAQMLMHIIVHLVCTNTVRESTLKVNSGRKIPCCAREFDLHQQFAGPSAYTTLLHPSPQLEFKPATLQYQVECFLTSPSIWFCGLALTLKQSSIFFKKSSTTKSVSWP